MCNISTRLDSLNQQLMIISKLQKMEEDCNMYPISTCKKCSIRNFGKMYHCAHHILSLNKFNCGDKCISRDESRKKIPCNSKTCKTRRKMVSSTDTKLAEVQADIRDDISVSKSTNVDIKPTLSQSYSQTPEISNKSDQISSQSYTTYVSNKVVNTHEEKSEQTIPTKDYIHTESSTSNSQIFANISQFEAPEKDESQSEVDRSIKPESNELEENYYNLEDIPVQDKKLFKRIQKDLSNERKRTKELEEKIKSLTCSLKCLKENSEQRAACLKAESEENLIKLVLKPSMAATNLIEASRERQLSQNVEKLQQQITEVTHENTALSKECENLKCKLQSYSEEEAKQCEEVEKEVNRMKHAAKEKEDALNMERAEFVNMIRELTNVINIQKRRICEVTGICNNQQHLLQNKDKELHEKINELSEVKQILDSSNCVCKELEEKIEDLEYCLCEERKACNCLREELESITENHSSEMRIKEKIVEEQIRTISKQRKLLQDSEEMAQQVACEFEQLKVELYNERQRNKSLQMVLDKTDTELNNAYLSPCQECKTLINEIDCLKKEKQRALTVAKLAYQKLQQSIKQYQSRLVYERQQYRYMASIVNKKEQEMECLKNQIYQCNSRSIERTCDYIM